MGEIIFRKQKINFNVEGNGNKVPLVLLHGFMEDRRIWKDIVSEFRTHRQVICIDLPGHGNSQGVAETHDMPLMAEVVAEVLANLGVKRVSMAGHSMGGYVCLEFLKKFPMLLQSIVLINSTPLEDSVEKRKIRERSLKLVEKNKSAFVSMAITNLYSEANREKLVKEINIQKKNARKMSVKNIQAAIKGMKIRTNNIQVLKSFDKQKILIASEDDSLLDMKRLKTISEESGSQFYQLSGGHNSYHEDAENLLKIMHLID